MLRLSTIDQQRSIASNCTHDIYTFSSFLSILISHYYVGFTI